MDIEDLIKTLMIAPPLYLPLFGLFLYFTRKVGWKEKRLVNQILSLLFSIIISFAFVMECQLPDKDATSVVEIKNVQEQEAKEDSLNTIITERSKTKFETSIFANIYFGNNPHIVEQKIHFYKKKFDNSIYIDSVAYKIRQIEPSYMKENFILW